MVARAESHGGLDQQGLCAAGHLVRIMAAVNKEASRLDRGQFAAHVRNPIGLRQFGHDKRLGPHGRRQHGQRRRIRCFLKIAAHFPKARSVFHLEHSDAGWLWRHVLHRIAQCIGGIASGQGREGGECGHLTSPVQVSVRVGGLCGRVKGLWDIRIKPAHIEPAPDTSYSPRDRPCKGLAIDHADRAEQPRQPNGKRIA